MKNLIIILFPFSFLICSCDKNKELVRYTSLYHIEGNDTISAIHIPNSFTPDGDGNNDLFKPIGFGIQRDEYELNIFNSNGELFFQTENIESYWDGMHKGLIAPSKSYECTINAKDSTGFVFEFKGKISSIKG
jgi:large repetitive protein